MTSPRRIIHSILTITIVSAIVAILYRVQNQNQVTPSFSSSATKIKVVASFYPLAEFSSQVGGELVEVVNITPTGVEPHDYELKPQDIALIQDQAQLIVINGSGIDPWADKLAPKLVQNSKQVLRITDNFDLLPGESGDGRAAEATDPHLWLDPVHAQRQVELIAEAYVRIDASHADQYRANAARYIERLRQLDQKYTSTLQNCRVRVVVVSHNAFRYLGQRYQFKVIPIAGLSPEAEPSTQAIQNIIQTAKAAGVEVIFFETLVSPKLADTIAREAGASTEVLNPLEGLTDQELAQNQNYVSIMESNLQNLSQAMQCFPNQ